MSDEVFKYLERGNSISDYKNKVYANADSLWHAENIDFKGEFHESLPEVPMFDYESGDFDVDFIAQGKEKYGKENWIFDGGPWSRGQHYRFLKSGFAMKAAEGADDIMAIHRFNSEIGSPYAASSDMLMDQLMLIDNKGLMFKTKNGTIASPYKLHSIYKENIYPDLLKEAADESFGSAVSLFDIENAEKALIKRFKDDIDAGLLTIVDKPKPPTKE